MGAPYSAVYYRYPFIFESQGNTTLIPTGKFSIDFVRLILKALQAPYGCENNCVCNIFFYLASEICINHCLFLTPSYTSTPHSMHLFPNIPCRMNILLQFKNKNSCSVPGHKIIIQSGLRCVYYFFLKPFIHSYN